MIDIEKKIEEIRQKPEYIRVRYVYGMVGVSMIMILFIWFISLKVNFSSFDNSVESGVSNIKNQFSNETENATTETGDKNEKVEIDKLLEESKKRAEQEEGISN